MNVTKIWDAAPHNAFTDLVRWRGQFYCAFREGQGHAGDRGKLRILVSKAGAAWTSAGLLADANYDLRDAALSVTPDNRLMVMGGAQESLNNGAHSTGTFVSFTSDGKSFSQPKIVIPTGRWLWRVTWIGDRAFGASYGTQDDRQTSRLHVTTDGETFTTLTNELFHDGEWPTEARIRFAEDGTAYCLHRRDGSNLQTAMFGVSEAPYKEWEWHDLKRRLGGPNFLQIPNGQWIACGRSYDGGTRTELLELDVEAKAMKPLLRLPSGGDTSYPGMVWHKDRLWISYYSSHEGRTSIYLAQVEFDNTPAIKIGSRLELFVDRHIIDRMDGCELRLHAPRKAERVLRFDKPWEGAFCGYTTVLKDDKTFRMYYRGLPKSGGDGSDEEVTCYAESRDGIQWTKPELGIHNVNGSVANNVILKGETPASHNFSPFLDTNPAAKRSERFKALAGTEASGLIAFASPDGKSWERMQQKAVFRKGMFDSQNVAFWSAAEEKYVCYFRMWSEGGYRGFRSVSRTTSEDFIHWSDPEVMSFGNSPAEHIYTNQTAPYFRAPHILIATAARFMPGRKVLLDADAKRLNVDAKYYNDCSDTVLMTSRGGSRYDRTFMESLIRPGLGLENWVSRTNYPALGIVPTSPTEMSMYLNRNYGQPTACLQRYTLRTDGMVSIHAGYDGGEVVSKPLLIPESPCELVLNMATSAAGSVKVELQDGNGAIAGYDLASANELIGDDIGRRVTWGGRSRISGLAGRPVRVRISMKDADVYSMQFRLLNR